MPHTISYTNVVSILLKEINHVRNNPQSLIPLLKDRILKYDEDGNYFPLAGFNFSVKTKEGIKGVQNLITYLENQRESPVLEWSYELHQAADKRCHFLGVSEQKNGLNRVAKLQIGQLVSQYTSWKGDLVQLTFFGFIQPRQFICQLLLEDGRQKKENRQQFFSRQLGFVGIGVNTHQKYRFVIVLICATQIQLHEPFMMYQHYTEYVQDLSKMHVPQEIPPIQERREEREPQCNVDDCAIY